jgi:hypothetical protein
MHLTEEAGQLVTQGLKSPHDFEYDKVFYPFIIFSKKRYVGNKYEEDPEYYSQTSMGIATKRRDNAPVVKTIYGGAIRILLTDKDIEAATRFVQEKTMDLVSGKMSMNQLTISKSLRAEYTKDKLIAELSQLEKKLENEDDEKEIEKLNKLIDEKTSSMNRASIPAHKILAKRMAERDPGNAPASGDRIPFVYIAAAPGQEASKLQGERVEHPSYVKQKGLQLDTKYYIEHQLMNPLSQLFALCLAQMPGYAGHKPGMEEVTASDLLFQKALNEADKFTQKQFAKKFGMTVIPRASAPVPIKSGGRTAAESKKAAPKQMQLDRFMLDSMLIEATKKKSPTKVKDANQPKEPNQPKEAEANQPKETIPKPKRSKKKAVAETQLNES